LAEILKECNGGTMNEFDDFDGLKRSVEQWYGGEKWCGREITAYSRKNLCGKMAELLF
jgi:hypothetical protein